MSLLTSPHLPKQNPVTSPKDCSLARDAFLSIQLLIELPQPNSTQPRVGLALFSYANHKPQPQNHKSQTTKPYPTLSQLLHNQTRPNSVYNLISTKLEDSCQKKLGQPPHPKKKSSNSKLNSTKFSMPPHRTEQ